MKYNRAEIMSRAWRIAENSAVKFGGKASEYITESLRISWLMAKVEILEGEKFLLNMRDISGGARNAVAQTQISEYNKELDRLSREIEALRLAIYPTVTVTETRNILSEKERDSLIRRIANLEEMTAQAESSADEFYYWNQLTQAKHELEESVRTYTRTVIDVKAYEAA